MSLSGNREFLFTDTDHFAQCHASTVCALPNGTLLCAWFAGTREKHPDVGIWGATYDGAQWSSPQVLQNVAPVAHWNPVLFRAPDDTLWLFFKVGARIRAWTTWVATSSDTGASWSDARELIPGETGGRGPVRSRPIVLTDGAWLAPASHESWRRWRVFVDRSEDAGASWTRTDYLDSAPAARRGRGCIQPALWESAPGRVHMLTRSTTGWICRSDSADGGRTWTPLAPTGMPNNNSAIDVVRLDDGRLVLACNPHRSPLKPRTPLSVFVSGDNGASWEKYAAVETARGEFSYPSLAVAGEEVVMSYTWRRRRIAVWRGRIASAG